MGCGCRLALDGDAKIGGPIGEVMGRRLYSLVAGCLLSWLLCIPLAWAGSTLDAVKERGFLRCGVAEIGVGLSYVNEAGDWAGFFPAYCRAVAAATLGSAEAVDFVLTEVGRASCRERV